VADDGGGLTGSEIQRRRTALGLDVRELARPAKVDRATLTAVERGTNQPRPATLRAILLVLDQLEHEDPEVPDDEPTARIVTFRLESPDGIQVTVKGPVEDLADLQASAAALLAQMQRSVRPPPE
jgi:predicted transcriptional regulator